MYWFYTLALHLLLLAWIPALFFNLIFTGKYRKSFFKRLGFGFPKFKDEGPLIWVHAVSVGEVKAIYGLVQKICAQNPQARLLVTTITETGQETAKNLFGDQAQVAYMPFDLPYIIRPIVNRLKPKWVLLSEGDLWFHFLDSAQKVGSRIFLVSGKLSERSFRRYRAFSFCFQSLMQCLDLALVKSSEDKSRFLLLGVNDSRIKVCGNLKLDQVPPNYSEQELSEFRQRLQIPEGAQVVVVGSTHKGEEKAIVDRLAIFFKGFPNLHVVVVPRHPERFNEVDNLLADYHPIRYSDSSEEEESQVHLLDEMGLLTKAYALANVAIVAGSFVPDIGGHNILEPMGQGVPTIFGPEMEKQKELVCLALTHKAAIECDLDTLSSHVRSLLTEPELAKEMRERAKQMLELSGGAVEKTWDELRLFTDYLY